MADEDLPGEAEFDDGDPADGTGGDVGDGGFGHGGLGEGRSGDGLGDDGFDDEDDEDPVGGHFDARGLTGDHFPHLGDLDDDYDVFGDVDPLPDAESWQVVQDLDDLDAFEQVFAEEGLKGVSMFCRDCDEEHYYRWDLLRNSLELLLETGEIPVHEPAFQPDPDDYVPWEYARGYVDALRDVGVDQRMPVGACPRCALALEGALESANWCPRCAAPLLGPRLAAALEEAGLSPPAIKHVLRAAGLPGRR